jgi:steroid delta-isomerase-like uncharacterized protein
MSTDLKSLARVMFETIDRQDWPAARELTSPSLRVSIGGQVLDRDGWIGMGQMFAAAFPDGKHQITDMIAEGDRVVVSGVWRGTHKGDFQGIPASGRSVEVNMIMVDRFAGGRIVEHGGLFDTLALLQQIGAFPAPRP